MKRAFMLDGLRRRTAVASLLAAGAIGALAPTQVMAQPTVVELFTSQGCSSCPPANANLIKLSAQPGVLALSFSVTYWDSLGWKDTFGRKDYTARQAAYEAPLGQSGPFTPQMVVEGRTSVVGNDLAQVEGAIARLRSADAGGPSITLGAGAVTIGPGRAPSGGADVWLARYDPRLVEVPVRRGENGGRTLAQKNVVHDLVRIGRWTGKPLVAPIGLAAPGWRSAVLVESRNGGPILAAASD